MKTVLVTACVVSMGLLYSPRASAQSRYTWFETGQFTGSQTDPYARNNGSDVDANGNPIAPDTNMVFIPDHPHSPATLLLFLPGHGGDNNDYTEFFAEAASQGYYVIGLAYRNGQSIQNMCGYWADCPSFMFDQDVSANTFWYFFSGTQASQPAAKNSVNYRLGQLLQHIDQVGYFLPFQFEQFYNYKTGDVNWGKIVIAGHSEGAATAAWITKNKGVIAGITFEGPYSDLDNAYAGPGGAYPGAPLGDSSYSPCDFLGCHGAFQSTGGAQNINQASSYLANDSSNWVDKLYITLNSYDIGYDNHASLAYCDPNNPGPTAAACDNNPCQGNGANWCFTPTWPGVNMYTAAMALGKRETQMASAPSSLGSHKWFTSTIEPNTAGCSGHLATIVNGCYPKWMPDYWDLVLKAALP